MYLFAYTSIVDETALAGMKSDALTVTTSALGVVIAIAAVGIIIRVLTK